MINRCIKKYTYKHNYNMWINGEEHKNTYVYVYTIHWYIDMCLDMNT